MTSTPRPDPDPRDRVLGGWDPITRPVRVPWFRLMIPTSAGPERMLEGPSRAEVYRGLAAHPGGWVERCEQITRQTPWIRDSP